LFSILSDRRTVAVLALGSGTLSVLAWAGFVYGPMSTPR
jgi:hypothetical protein